MKKRLFILSVVMSIVIPMFAQGPSTVGREFWVALTLSANPDHNNLTDFQPFIAISAQDYSGCQVTLTTPANPSWSYSTTLTQAWTIIESSTMLASGWYNVGFEAQAETVQNQGVLVTSTKDVSVFCAWQGNQSFDASNILPTTVLTSEYIVQDYPPYDNDGKTGFTTFAIVATEDNTIVDITPKNNTYKQSNIAGKTFQSPSLKKGQVYHVLSVENNNLSGTYIKAKDNKKIAVFNGDVMTRVPDKKMGNRDLLYEQAMPTDYWGTEFVVARSLRKDANRVRITAIDDGTKVTIADKTVTIDARDTYEFELCPDGFIPKSTRESALPDQYFGDAVYIKSECPVAVYMYDVGKSYMAKSNSEVVSGKEGDPSMVWISPLEQRIKTITFGACGTTYTKDHCITIVRQKGDEITLVSTNGQNMLTTADVFVAIPGTEYEYLRKLLIENQTQNTISYTLTSKKGIIAQVYGHGQNESYSYSVGSAAVKRGLMINDELVEDGQTLTTQYCLNSDIHMNVSSGSSVFDEVLWDLGDGTTLSDGAVEVNHVYESPGWYDLTAILTGHSDCPSVPSFTKEKVTVHFRVVKPDTMRVHDFCCVGDLPYTSPKLKRQFTKAVKDSMFLPDNCADTVFIYSLSVGDNVDTTVYITAKDEYEIDGKVYTESAIINQTLKSHYGCDSTVTVNLTVVTCLHASVDVPYGDLCADQAVINFPVSITRGEMNDATLVVGGKSYPMSINGNSLEVETKNFRPGYYEGEIKLKDDICETTLSFPVSFTVKFASSIVIQKWDDILAVTNAKYNGGYTFSSYLWLKDGAPITGIRQGETGSWIQLSTAELDPTAEYSVLLTTTDGLTLETCPKLLISKQSSSASVNPAFAPAGSDITIQTQGRATAGIYSAMGQTYVEGKSFEDKLVISAPAKAGVYVVRVTRADGKTDALQIIVQ